MRPYVRMISAHSPFFPMSASLSRLSGAVAAFDGALSAATDFVSAKRGKISAALLSLSAAATLLVFVPGLLKETGSWALFLLVFIMFLSPLASIT